MNGYKIVVTIEAPSTGASHEVSSRMVAIPGVLGQRGRPSHHGNYSWLTGWQVMHSARGPSMVRVAASPPT